MYLRLSTKQVQTATYVRTWPRGGSTTPALVHLHFHSHAEDHLFRPPQESHSYSSLTERYPRNFPQFFQTSGSFLLQFKGWALLSPSNQNKLFDNPYTHEQSQTDTFIGSQMINVAKVLNAPMDSTFILACSFKGLVCLWWVNEDVVETVSSLLTWHQQKQLFNHPSALSYISVIINNGENWFLINCITCKAWCQGTNLMEK